MRAAALRDEIVADSVALAWDQWSQLGVSGHVPRRREERAADPEALLLFTLEAGRSDPRLFDEVLDWLATNEHLLSVHRLRNLCSDETDAALVNASLGSSLGSRAPGGSKTRASRPAQLEPLFWSVPAPTAEVDESFEFNGFARSPFRASGKSQKPRLRDPISFAFRMRRLLGVGVRAEVIRVLLTTRAPRLSGRVITADASFAQRNVREGLTHLVEAGVIDVGEISDDRYYSIRHADWASLLGLSAAPELPFHYEWIPTLRALTRIVRWLRQPGLDELSAYLQASKARTLVDDIAAELQSAGIPLGLFTALAPDFWDDFTAITRMLVRNAKGLG
jgi:hypothetical protein